MTAINNKKSLGRVCLIASLVATAWLPGSALAAAPSAGTVIGNQASASYVDAGGTARSTTSNLVQTSVSQVKTFAISANNGRTAAPGQTVYYPHTITNTGNGTDTLSLAAPTTGGAFAHTGLAYYIDANGDGVPDNNTPITSTGPLAAGAQFKFVVAAVVPAATSSGTTGTIIVSATDTGGNTFTNTDTTTAANSAIAVTESLSSTAGPSPATGLTVTLQYTNSGTASGVNLALGDILPAGLTYVPGSARWSGSGATALVDSGVGEPAGIAFDYGVTTAGKVTATVANVAAGASGYLTFQVNVNAGLSPTDTSKGAVCLTAGCVALTTNTATYTTSTQASTSTNAVTYSVLQTGALSFNGSAVSNVSGTGSPITVASAGQGSVVTFTDYVWNLGNGPDSFDVTVQASTYPAGTTFQFFKADGTTPLIDTNGNSTPDTGPMAPGANYAIVVKATLPTSGTVGNNGGAGFTATLKATSKFDTTVSSTVIDKVGAIVANTVDVTDTLSVSGGALVANGLGSTGATVINTKPVSPTNAPIALTFKLFVNNTGVTPDSYDLAVTSGIPTGWSVAFKNDGGNGDCSTTGTALTNTGAVLTGASKMVCAVVTVPAIASGYATPGARTFTFNAQSSSTGASNDALTDQVTVNAVHAVTVTPNGTQQTYAGGAVTYTHMVTNMGNAAETVSFAAGFLSDSQVAAGWTSAVYVDTNSDGVLQVGTDALVTVATTIPLAPNATATVFVRAFAPGSAKSFNPANITTLVATYSATTSSATDTTTVTDGLLLYKEQVAVSCSNVTPSGYSNAAIPAGSNTAPGQCIAYRITATNTTASTVTTVQIADTIPANTTLKVACGAPAATAGAVVSGTATDGTAGTVDASLASLASNASFQTTFCVQINQ